MYINQYVAYKTKETSQRAYVTVSAKLHKVTKNQAKYLIFSQQKKRLRIT